jgi:hypothetical protein
MYRIILKPSIAIYITIKSKEDININKKNTEKAINKEYSVKSFSLLLSEKKYFKEIIKNNAVKKITKSLTFDVK